MIDICIGLEGLKHTHLVRTRVRKVPTGDLERLVAANVRREDIVLPQRCRVARGLPSASPQSPHHRVHFPIVQAHMVPRHLDERLGLGGRLGEPGIQRRVGENPLVHRAERARRDVVALLGGHCMRDDVVSHWRQRDVQRASPQCPASATERATLVLSKADSPAQQSVGRCSPSTTAFPFPLSFFFFGAVSGTGNGRKRS